MPLKKWKAVPPIAPVPNAPPMSSRMRSGQGSRDVSGLPIWFGFLGEERREDEGFGR